MTFDTILKLLRDNSRTDWQKAADIHALLQNEATTPASVPRPANWTAKARKPRGPNKPKPPVLELAPPNGLSHEHE